MPTESLSVSQLAVRDQIKKSCPEEVELADAMHREVYIDERGTYRFKQNFAVRAYVDSAKDGHGGCIDGRFTINDLWLKAHSQPIFPLADIMAFYMDMGYSLHGFWEVFGQCEAEDWRLPGAIPSEHKEDERTQTPVDWMLAKLRGGK